MDTAPPAATATLGPPILTGGLRVKGAVLILFPILVIAYALLPLSTVLPYRLAVVAALVGLLGLVIVYFHRQSIAYSVHRDGLLIRRGWRWLPVIGHRSEVYRWDDIATVSRRITSRYLASRDDYAVGPTYFRYELGTFDGRRLVLDSRYGDFEEAGEVLMARIRRVLLPQLLARYDRGETIAFGPLKASQVDLAWGERAIPWPGVVAASVKRGMLTLECQTSPRLWRTSLGAIPNVDCFFALLAERQPQVWVAANPAHFAEIKRIGAATNFDE